MYVTSTETSISVTLDNPYKDPLYNTICWHEKPTHPKRYFDVCEEDGKIFFKHEGTWKRINFTRRYMPQDKRLDKKNTFKNFPRHKRWMTLEDGETVVFFTHEKHKKASQMGVVMRQIAKDVRPGWYYIEEEVLHG